MILKRQKKKKKKTTWNWIKSSRAKQNSVNEFSSIIDYASYAYCTIKTRSNGQSWLWRKIKQSQTFTGVRCRSYSFQFTIYGTQTLSLWQNWASEMWIANITCKCYLNRSIWFGNIVQRCVRCLPSLTQHHRASKRWVSFHRQKKKLALRWQSPEILCSNAKLAFNKKITYLMCVCACTHQNGPRHICAFISCFTQVSISRSASVKTDQFSSTIGKLRYNVLLCNKRMVCQWLRASTISKTHNYWIRHCNLCAFARVNLYFIAETSTFWVVRN